MARARIVGLVARGGVAMAQSRRADGRWETPTLVVTLRPWRKAGGPIRTEELAVRRRTRLPYELWRLLMPAGRSIALTVDLDEQDPGRAQLRNYRFWRRRAALEEARRQWAAAKKLDDPRFGAFAFEERVQTYERRITWCGEEVVLSINAHDRSDPHEQIDVAKRLLDSANEWNRRIRERIVEELLPLFNDSWRDESEPPLDDAGLLSAIRLEAIAVDGAELVNFYYDDGGLFAAHTINVGLWLEEDMVCVDLAG